MVNSKKLTFNKKIYTLRLGITNACTNKCKYCFIKKGNKTINFLTAQKVIDFWFDAPGENKDLKIYGGTVALFSFGKKDCFLCFSKKEKGKKKNNHISCNQRGSIEQGTPYFSKKN